MSDKRIVIMGAGAAGSYLGAYMTKEGHDVTLVDMWGEHVETMQKQGCGRRAARGISRFR